MVGGGVPGCAPGMPRGPYERQYRDRQASLAGPVARILRDRGRMW